MKTLTDFKRALTLGSIWNCTHVSSGKSLGDRTVVKVQSNAVTFENIDGVTSSLYFPKASEYEFNNGKAEIYYPACIADDKPRRLILTYTKLEG